MGVLPRVSSAGIVSDYQSIAGITVGSGLWIRLARSSTRFHGNWVRLIARYLTIVVSEQWTDKRGWATDISLGMRKSRFVISVLKALGSFCMEQAVSSPSYSRSRLSCSSVGLTF